MASISTIQNKPLPWSRWKPKLSRASNKGNRKRYGKTWKAYERFTSKGLPVFEAGITSHFMTGKPQIDLIKYHIGGFGAVFELDLEATDKLITLLKVARAELVKRTDSSSGKSEAGGCES